MHVQGQVAAAFLAAPSSLVSESDIVGGNGGGRGGKVSDEATEKEEDLLTALARCVV